MQWVRQELRRLVGEPATDQLRALAAEVEAALRLSWIDTVIRVPEAKHPTCDLRVGELNVEVYCPQQHVEERLVTEATLREAIKNAVGPVKVATAVTYPTTGSGRVLADDGSVVRAPGANPLDFPSNKVIDRLLSAKKRRATQFSSGEANVLWLDLKMGLGLTAVDCAPLRSVVAKETCFVGMYGVWHAFYGRSGAPFFGERTALEYRAPPDVYLQQRDGWFRQEPRASCAILSVLDGTVRMDNPWAEVPLTQAQSEKLARLSEWRPEYSYFDPNLRTLEVRVEADLERNAWLAGFQAAVDVICGDT